MRKGKEVMKTIGVNHISVLENKQYITDDLSLLHYCFKHKVNELLLFSFYWAKCQFQKGNFSNCVSFFLSRCLSYNDSQNYQ